MQPPIPLGTILQNRYRLINILGQGGFGRTYLAADQGRFNELCALKELIPASTENYVWEKSKELFQREASILYQIQHPQIPQFRATFEQDQRLFLVQDYVEGKTYRSLLDQRQLNNQTFSEAEVLQLLRQLLPVLAHLHFHGIIHRDISPDNIILRESDRLPVLIDFGVVKELASRFQSPDVIESTKVGKLGYAPSEQMQTGRAYPSSDLYSLAVTALVLLTGREPQELFDDTQLTWNWERWARINPEFAQVLQRMLSYKPGDRYQSVAEVAKALPNIAHQVNLPTPAPEVSQIKTIAVSRPDAIQSYQPNRPTPVIPAPTQRDIWRNPWAVIFIGTIVAALAGITGWTIMSFILSTQRPIPQTFPSPLISESPTPTPTPTPTVSVTPTPSSEPVSYSQRLDLIPGEANSLEGILKANTTVNYIFNGEQNQQLSATLAKEGVLLTVLAPNGEAIAQRSPYGIAPAARRVTRYEGALPFTGEYTIELSPVQGVNESNYQLDLRLDNSLEPTPTPTESPTPTPTINPTFDLESVQFNPGETGTQVSGQTTQTQIKRYLVNVQAGQVLSVTVQTGGVTLDIRNPNGELVENASRVLSWQAQVPESGAYQIDVIANQEQAEFTLDISAENLE